MVRFPRIRIAYYVIRALFANWHVRDEARELAEEIKACDMCEMEPGTFIVCEHHTQAMRELV